MSTDSTTVHHIYGDAPEQVAVDMLRAAFGAISAVQARDDSESERLAWIQGTLNAGYKAIREMHPGVCN